MLWVARDIVISSGAVRIPFKDKMKQRGLLRTMVSVVTSESLNLILY
jgi:hypothetical protein